MGYLSYPINDIFEGTGDLLIKHGEILRNIHPSARERDIHLNYGGYTYILRYGGGELRDITRIDLKEEA